MKDKRIVGLLIILIVVVIVFIAGGLFIIFQLDEPAGGLVEEFNEAMEVYDGKSFGPGNFLTFELFRNGTFAIIGNGYASQQSDSYLDSAIIRSTEALPGMYKIEVVVGEIDYGLPNISGLGNDPQYQEGPQNENGCYLIAITDERPDQHYTNDWWHQHRKLVIDVDNNVWGHGMPNPIFMVYFDKSNQLVSYSGQNNDWNSNWTKAVEYEFFKWYKITVEKTPTKYIFTIAEEDGKILKQSEIALDMVWHTEPSYPEYFVIGDPHENYYQGGFKIKSIAMTH